MDHAVAEPSVKNMTWPQVVVILGLTTVLMTAVIILSLNGKDAGTILGAVGTVIIGLATAFGLDLRNQVVANRSDVAQVRELSNGRLSELLDRNKELQAQVTTLALRLPPPGPDGVTTVTTTTKTDPS
jgi:hypothetical protein